MSGLRIGLVHQGWPAGSFVTTRGLERAFQRRDDVAQTFRVPAAELRTLPSDLDFVFVEGFPGRQRWAELQRLPVTKYFWWLSTNFGRMSADRLAESTFNHVFTNSSTGLAGLSGRKPATLMPLAFDREMAEQAQVAEPYQCDVTYLGISGHKSRQQLQTLIEPATHFNFHLWGKGWRWTRYFPYHRGILPADDIPKLYASARVVLGMTELRQQAMGMINNRVFEALGCAGTLVADAFPALESLFEDRILYTRSPDDTRRVLMNVLQEPAEFARRAQDNQRWILDHHTYDHRADTILRVHRDAQ